MMVAASIGWLERKQRSPISARNCCCGDGKADEHGEHRLKPIQPDEPAEDQADSQENSASSEARSQKANIANPAVLGTTAATDTHRKPCRHGTHQMSGSPAFSAKGEHFCFGPNLRA